MFYVNVLFFALCSAWEIFLLRGPIHDCIMHITCSVISNVPTKIVVRIQRNLKLFIIRAYVYADVYSKCIFIFLLSLMNIRNFGYQRVGYFYVDQSWSIKAAKLL